MDNVMLPPTDVEMSSSLGQFLLQDQLIDPTRLAHAMMHCRSHSMALTHYLVKSNSVSSQVLFACCLRHFTIPLVDLSVFDVSTFLHDPLIPVAWMRHFRILPIRNESNQVFLGVTDPTCFSVLAKVRFHTGREISLCLLAEEALESLFVSVFGESTTHSLTTLVHQIVPPVAGAASALYQAEDESDDEPVTKLVSQLLSDAEMNKASDIHCEPYCDDYRIRFRIDGQLQHIITVPRELALRMQARIKLLASLDIAEKRLPQDGRIGGLHTGYLEMRVSTCPTVSGEKLVLRLFRQHQNVLMLTQLGFFDEQLHDVMQAIQKPHGLILVSGPTGSGKTATLYAMIDTLKTAAMNITTIEEPVEMMIPGINQMNVNPRIGLSFSALLRAMLRQDPDVIMIGEIRDAETAAIAVQAASTGHLVLGTLHANHSLAAIHRLGLLGVSPDDSMQSVIMVISQRLLRQLCNHCKKRAGNETADGYKAIGCEWCRDGYQGRMAAFEVLTFDHALSALFLQKLPISQLVMTLKERGWLPLYQAAMRKVLLGITSAEEVRRVIAYV